MSSAAPARVTQVRLHPLKSARGHRVEQALVEP